MKTVIRSAAVLLTLALLCSCARADRFGVWELEQRLRETDRAYAFGTESMFRKDGVYYIFYSTVHGTLLLKAKEDDKQRLTDLSLTTAQTDADTAARFSALACALTDVFLPEDARADAKASLRLADPSSFFSDETLTAVYGRYRAAFFKTAHGASLMLTCTSRNVSESVDGRDAPKKTN